MLFPQLLRNREQAQHLDDQPVLEAQDPLVVPRGTPRVLGLVELLPQRVEGVDRQESLGVIELPEPSRTLERFVAEPQTDRVISHDLASLTTRTLGTHGRVARSILGGLLARPTGSTGRRLVGVGRSQRTFAGVVLEFTFTRRVVRRRNATRGDAVEQKVSQPTVLRICQQLTQPVHRLLTKGLMTLLDGTPAILVVQITTDRLEPLIDHRIQIDQRFVVLELRTLLVERDVLGLDDAFEEAAAESTEALRRVVPAGRTRLTHELAPGDPGRAVELGDLDATRQLSTTLDGAVQLEADLAHRVALHREDGKLLAGVRDGNDVSVHDRAVGFPQHDPHLDASFEHHFTELVDDRLLEVVEVHHGDRPVLEETDHAHHSTPLGSEVIRCSPEGRRNRRKRGHPSTRNLDLARGTLDAGTLEGPFHRGSALGLAREQVLVALAQRADQTATEATETVLLLDRAADTLERLGEEVGRDSSTIVGDERGTLLEVEHHTDERGITIDRVLNALDRRQRQAGVGLGDREQDVSAMEIQLIGQDLCGAH